MADVNARGPVKRVQIEMTVIRADGTVEELGRVADSSRWWRWGWGRRLAARRVRAANANRSV
jgi:hypothetical protein